jgi:SAM-dependent methyltransferase
MHSLDQISKNVVSRYSDRYKQLGYNIRTLGWGTVDQQNYRFEKTLSLGIDFSEKTILDIGCGFGDYASFLSQNIVHHKSYYGIDINPDLIGEAKTRFDSQPFVNKIRFSVLDILTSQPPRQFLGDIGVMLGLLNLNLAGQMDNYEYTKRMIGNALPLVREALIVDFLSSHRDESYPKEDFVFYHDPSTILNMVLNFSSNFSLHHDYLPIPQKEFMIVIRK